MCGIVGAVSKKNVATRLMNGLKKLEYRGYDSSGIAIINGRKNIKCLRLAGKVRELAAALAKEPFDGHIGIAHTRWATHGEPSEKNAHPFISHDEFALVHNGIIENYIPLRDQLIKDGYQFQSDTDTEVIVHLVHKFYSKNHDFIASVRATTNELKGAYALAIICKFYPDHFIAVRKGSPIVIGEGQNENFIASDPLALIGLTRHFIYLEDLDLVYVGTNSIDIYDKNHKLVQREQHVLNISRENTERGKHRHFMKKEIMEQADAIHTCLEGHINQDHLLPNIFGPTSDKIFSQVKHLQIVACGTSFHAAAVARYWCEELAKIPCSVEVASEFRYRQIAKPEDSLFVVLSQSGETADTLQALRKAKEMGYLSTLAICNVQDSTIMRESDLHFLTHAGVEIGVASTKAFVTQLVALFLLILTLDKKHIPQQLRQELIYKLTELPESVEMTFEHDSTIANWAKSFQHKQHAIFLGRGMLYPIALEGALKMKEISYIHAEAYPAGELKHGPLALIDNNMPVIALAPTQYLLEKNLSNLQEVHTRGGILYIITDNKDNFKGAAFEHANILVIPTITPLLTPILYTVPLQLLAYHVAVLKGTDIDQPRNLAKSVTVE